MANDKTPTTVLPTIPEVQGIVTATTGIEAIKERLLAAIDASGKAQAELEEFRKHVNAMPEKTAVEKMQKAFTVEHQAELEAQIADNGRKAVNAALQEVNVHIGAIQTHAMAIRAKYGKQENTVKKADRGTGRGDITTGNMDALRELLTSRGLVVSFELQDDSKHYTAVSGDRRSKYASNVRDDWK